MPAATAITSPDMAPVEPPPGLEHLAAPVSRKNEERQRRRNKGVHEVRYEKRNQKRSEKEKGQEKEKEKETSVLPPPGLVLPPGLEELEDSTTASNDSEEISPSSPMYIKSSAIAADLMPAHRLQISGLPNAILSNLMLEAVLQQAQLSNYVVSFTTKPGKVSGEAIVTLVSEEAAEWCAQHFQGCRWCSSGTAVSIRHLPPPETKAASAPTHKSARAVVEKPETFPSMLSAEAAEFQPSQAASAMWTDLSVDAPVFMPGAFTAAATYEASTYETSMLCAEAPVFVPSLYEDKDAQKFVTSSDVSTEDLGSESDVDRSAP